jgi:hypothetical protein
MYQDASIVLNALIKEGNATGLHLWTESEAVLFVAPGQTRYVLGPNSTDNVTNNYTSNYVETYLTVVGLVGASTITVADATDIFSGDHIGVLMDDQTLFWTTVNGAPVANVVTLTDILPSSASANNFVFDYTTRLGRPLRVVDARRHLFQGNIDSSMIPMSRLDYREQPNKTTQGTVTQFFYDPQLTNGYLYLWPAPSNSDYSVKFTWYRSLEDMVAAGNTLDFPQEWINAVTKNLAKELCLEYDVPPAKYAMIAQEAAQSLAVVMNWDREPESLFFGVAFEQQSR